MNPSSNEGLQLPAPVSSEQLPETHGTEPAAGVAPEQAPAGPERQLGAAQAAVAAVPAMPLPGQAGQKDSSATTSQSDVNATSQWTAGLTADDNDLIEKEWVERAKQIVERTRDNPYQQSEQLTAFKADYMQKRYGKTIKVDK